MTCELGSEVACHRIDTFTAQQNDTVILQALLRASLLRSTRAIVPADVLRTISATQQANSLRNVVTPAPPSRDFFGFRRISAVCPPPMTYDADGTLLGPQKAIQGRGEQRYNSIPPSRSRCCCSRWRRRFSMRSRARCCASPCFVVVCSSVNRV